MKKLRNSKPFCLLLVLMLLMQSMTVPVVADENGDSADDYCKENQGAHTVTNLSLIHI